MKDFSSGFSTTVFQEVQPLLKLIFDHPFIAELAKGTLSRERFCFYMQQDSFYLIHFARALALTSSRTTDEKQMELLMTAARNALLDERSLHEHYFTEYGVSEEIKRTPACMGYTSFLLASASLGTLGEALAALLSCFWVYREVGRQLAREAAPANPYAKWIALYSDKDFSDATDRFVTLTDAVAAEAAELELKSMKDHFMIASHFEYYFWDDVYRMKTMEYTETVK